MIEVQYQLRVGEMVVVEKKEAKVEFTVKYLLLFLFLFPLSCSFKREVKEKALQFIIVEEKIRQVNTTGKKC